MPRNPRTRSLAFVVALVAAAVAAVSVALATDHAGEYDQHRACVVNCPDR